VARYSWRLAQALATELEVAAPGAALDCFADGLDRLKEAAGPLQARPAPVDGGAWFDARHLAFVEGALGGYDRTIYVLGNSEFHSAALSALRRRSGIVMAHDVRVTELLRHSSGAPGAVPGGLEGAIRRAYGDAVADDLGRNGPISEADYAQLGLLLLADIVPQADRLLVSSEAARKLAAADVAPEYAGRLGILPFAMALDGGELEVIAAARGERSERHRALVASFGIVDPIKLPHLLLDAVTAVCRHVDVELAFVGPVSHALAEQLSARACELGIGDRVRITGHLERSDYLRHLGMAAVAVQLRATFAGEASAAVGDCLAAGLPTTVSNLGWMADLPDGTVVKLESSSAPAAVDELAAQLTALIHDPDRRAGLSERAAAYAADQTFARAAQSLVAALGLP
jgi:glycosyltransferase involved in cell wall biosynthesis